MNHGTTRAERAAAAAMAAQGALVLGMWAGYARRGAFSDGARTVENGMYLACHVAAETVMGLLLLVGGGALLAGRRWGRAVGLAGCGAVTYSTVNALGDTLRNRHQLTPVLLANLGIAVGVGAVLVRGAARRSRRAVGPAGPHE